VDCDRFAVPVDFAVRVDFALRVDFAFPVDLAEERLELFLRPEDARSLAADIPPLLFVSPRSERSETHGAGLVSHYPLFSA
jgi:hypothetical protein